MANPALAPPDIPVSVSCFVAAAAVGVDDVNVTATASCPSDDVASAVEADVRVEKLLVSTMMGEVRKVVGCKEVAELLIGASVDVAEREF